MNEEFGLKQREAEIEKLTLQLAACSIASHQNTEETIQDRFPKDHPAWSSSYQDVCNAVDREMALREQRDRFAKALTNPQHCPNCPDQGWYVMVDNHGEQEQVQCQWCNITPDSLFNIFIEAQKEKL